MTTAAPTTFDRFRQWPRAMQWALLAALGLAMFMLWDRVLSRLTAEMEKKADAIVTQAAEIRHASSIVSDLQSRYSDAVQGIGPVGVLVSAAKGADELDEVVNTVLKKHASVSNQSFDMRAKGKLPPGTVVADKRLDRLTCDLKFLATPEDTTAIIAELESSPVITSINTVRIVRDANRKVKVNLTIESWVYSSDTGKAPR